MSCLPGGQSQVYSSAVREESRSCRIYCRHFFKEVCPWHKSLLYTSETARAKRWSVTSVLEAVSTSSTYGEFLHILSRPQISRYHMSGPSVLVTPEGSDRSSRSMPTYRICIKIPPRLLSLKSHATNRPLADLEPTVVGFYGSIDSSFFMGKKRLA
jgi:hypothetical protein